MIPPGSNNWILQCSSAFSLKVVISKKPDKISDGTTSWTIHQRETPIAEVIQDRISHFRITWSWYWLHQLLPSVSHLQYLPREDWVPWDARDHQDQSRWDHQHVALEWMVRGREQDHRGDPLQRFHACFWGLGEPSLEEWMIYLYRSVQSRRSVWIDLHFWHRLVSLHHGIHCLQYRVTLWLYSLEPSLPWISTNGSQVVCYIYYVENDRV